MLLIYLWLIKKAFFIKEGKLHISNMQCISTKTFSVIFKLTKTKIKSTPTFVLQKERTFGKKRTLG